MYICMYAGYCLVQAGSDTDMCIYRHRLTGNKYSNEIDFKTTYFHSKCTNNNTNLQISKNNISALYMYKYASFAF